MKKALKILAWIGGSLFVLLLGALVVVFVSLPSPGEIAKKFSKSANKNAVASQPATEPSSSSVAQAQSTSETGSDPDAQADSDDSGRINANTQQGLEVLENLTDPKQKKYDVCGQLKNYQLMPENFVYTSESLKKNMGDLFTTDHKDPMLMAVMGPVRLFLQQPSMKELISQVNQAAKDNQYDSLKNKATFYTQVYKAYEEMKATKPAAEALVDRGYHLFMMSKAVSKNPSLLSDSQFMDYCQSIEEASNSGVPLQWQAEQSEFQKFLAESHIDPNDIGYDPNYKTELVFEKKEGSIQFHGGWLDSVFPTPPKKK